MRQFKKALNVLFLATVLVLSLAVSAFATDITVIDGVDGAEYSAYKILNATDGGNGKFAYTLNEKYAEILKNVTGKESQADIVDYISNLDETAIRAFADAVYAAITADTSITADYTTDNDVFANVDQGYYLIAETKTASNADTISLVMLKTAGQDNIEVITKEDLPTVDKYVREVNDSTEMTSIGKHADHDIGDVINYFIMGTVSDKYAYYGSYYYCFEDTMAKGLTYNEDAVIYVSNNVSPSARVDVTEYFTIETTTNTETGNANGFKAYANLKEIPNVTIDEKTTIIVEYTVTLNEYAIQGEIGNENEVVLKYENDPYVKADGVPETPDEPKNPGETPKDINIVFTFGANVDKVDNTGAALEGAGFTLYKWYQNQNDWVAVGEEITGVTTFNFRGLDAGNYKLEETTVPQGYNKCDDVFFNIESVYDKTKTPVELTDLVVKDPEGNLISDGNDAVFNVDVANGNVSTEVVNVSGSELPQTGGIGTTIFYVIGGVLVVAAIVLLVAKKRMSQE